MTKNASKLLIKDTSTNTYLIMYRANHPHFGDAIDLPGGTVEAGETAVQATIREVIEEAQIDTSHYDYEQLYDGTKYSRFLTRYTLYTAQVQQQPEVTLSWEHKAYAWLPKDEIVKQCRASNDKFMYMVAEKIEKML